MKSTGDDWVGASAAATVPRRPLRRLYDIMDAGDVPAYEPVIHLSGAVQR